MGRAGRVWSQVLDAEYRAVGDACSQDTRLSADDLHPARLRRNAARCAR